MNKPKMTNKKQLIKICKCTVVVFAIIITAAYCSCYFKHYSDDWRPGDLNYAKDFAKVISGFFFDDTKVPIPIRSLFAVAVTVGAFSL